jgi:hypothetical protein
MFEQTSRLAEKVAASVSRRGFLGSLGGWAAAAAIGVAGMLTVGTARAGDKPTRVCMYFGACTGQPAFCGSGNSGFAIPCPYVCLCIPRDQTCPATCKGYNLLDTFLNNQCSDCCPSQC